MDYDDENQIVSFQCVGNQPNCIVLLFKNGQIYHCLFMPSTGIKTSAVPEEVNMRFKGKKTSLI